MESEQMMSARQADKIHDAVLWLTEAKERAVAAVVVASGRIGDGNAGAGF
jgi:predicted butyrate kinase (DUF1464 family)